jgi:hypothetical protein
VNTLGVILFATSLASATDWLFFDLLVLGLKGTADEHAGGMVHASFDGVPAIPVSGGAWVAHWGLAAIRARGGMR